MVSDQLENSVSALVPAVTPQELYYPSEKEQAATGFLEPIVTVILDNVFAGVTLEDAAGILKMPFATVNHWYRTNYCNFRYAVEERALRSKRSHVVKGQQGNKASQWWLERKFKHEFSKEVTVNVNHRIIDDVAEKVAAVAIKHIKDPETLRLFGQEVRDELNTINLESIPVNIKR